MCNLQSVQRSVPHEVRICLGRGFDQRRDALTSIKHRKFRAALEYISERTRFLDPYRPFTESFQFLLDNGDYCALITEMTPFDAALISVRRAYDVALALFANVEMRVTDVFGDITTRDEADYGIDGTQQNRYVSNLSCGVPIEMNTVMNWEFLESNDEFGDGGPIGVLTADFVDHDELYPYHQHDRLRQDITAVTTIRSCSRKRSDHATDQEEVEAVVVVTRSYFVRLHRSEMTLPPFVEHELREQLGRWGEVFVRGMLEHMYAS